VNFSSFPFLSLFLPFFIVLYIFSAPRHRNLLALLASVLFFSIGQIYYLPILAIIIIVDYYISRGLEYYRQQQVKELIILFVGIVLNLLPLVFFKVIASYGVNWLDGILPGTVLDILSKYLAPLGLSYIVFQLIAYLVDVHNECCESEKSFKNFALYIMLFPKLLVGPIVRYRDISEQLSNRELHSHDVADGVRRFIRGLAKKILIADTLAAVVNPAFKLDFPNFSPALAWFVLIAYALQLYFDFSGLTDMAIGLGRLLGFTFMENFNYPYISRSISEFWRRWHISLSTWFREYVFYPLEFTRRKSNLMVQPLNILIVFLLTGLWHGLTLNFILWGGVHGVALALEAAFLGQWLKKLWRPIQHLYTLLVVLIGWVLFRSPDLHYAFGFLARLVGSTKGITPIPFSITQPLPIIDHTVWLAVIFGILFSLPVIPFIQKKWARLTAKIVFFQVFGNLTNDLVLLLMLILVASSLVSRTNLPASIYAGF
jgi:alginate O-acetyltransferase complex protein AlgI